MEPLKLIRLPLEAARYAGHQLLGGRWGELPPLPQGEIRRPSRLPRQVLEVPDNIELGTE